MFLMAGAVNGDEAAAEALVGKDDAAHEADAAASDCSLGCKPRAASAAGSGDLVSQTDRLPTQRAAAPWAAPCELVPSPRVVAASSVGRGGVASRAPPGGWL
eukprot:Selendium_serpulae@DN11796_c0_g1_i1.p1